MRSAMIIAGGFLLLGICVLIAKLGARTQSVMATAALLFIPIWLLCAAVNMWMGVARAGYSVKEEFPIFLIIFAIPAIAAYLLRWYLRS